VYDDTNTISDSNPEQMGIFISNARMIEIWNTSFINKHKLKLFNLFSSNKQDYFSDSNSTTIIFNNITVKNNTDTYLQTDKIDYALFGFYSPAKAVNAFFYNSQFKDNKRCTEFFFSWLY